MSRTEVWLSKLVGLRAAPPGSLQGSGEASQLHVAFTSRRGMRNSSGAGSVWPPGGIMATCRGQSSHSDHLTGEQQMKNLYLTRRKKKQAGKCRPVTLISILCKALDCRDDKGQLDNLISCTTQDTCTQNPFGVSPDRN